MPGVGTGDDQTMDRIMRATALHQRGDPAAATAAFTALWAEIGPDGDPLHVVALAHYFADVHDDPARRQEWDLVALAAADSLTDDRARSYHASLDVLAFYPSLHANVAENYAALGEDELARHHLAAAREHQERLGQDAYGELMRGYLDKIEARLATVQS